MKSKMLWILLALLVLICVISFHTNSVIAYCSLGSLGVTALSFLGMHRIERRKLEIEEERRSEEMAASLTPYFHSSGNVRKLRIENTGNGEARNIKVLLDGKPLDERHPLWWKRQPQISTKLSGHEHRDYILYLSPSALPKSAEIHWDDDAKDNNVKECLLPL